MNNTSKRIWEKLEENIGRCILFRDAALKEMLGKEGYTLQFATLSVPERVEEFLDKTEGIYIVRKESGNYIFSLDNTRVEVHCYDAKMGFEDSYDKMFSRTLRCENLGINIMGQFNNNISAYKDILAKELHFATKDAKITEFLVSKIVRYVLNSGFVIGDDIIEYSKQNKTFENKVMRGRLLAALSDNIKKPGCTWERVAEVLRLIEDFLPSKDIIQYTKNLGIQEKDEKFIRNYLYSLFIPLEMTAQELHKVIPKEPTLEYFDSLAMNIGVNLGDYKTYIGIKKKYDSEFLELLIDVQESVSNSLGIVYKRVSDETFDMGEMFFKDKRFWCSLGEMKEPQKEVDVVPATNDQEDVMDVSKGNFAGWTKDEFDKEMYSEETEETDTEKVYIDDEVATETVDTGIDMAALDAYEEGFSDTEVIYKESQTKVVPPKLNEGIMNSQRGHESTVLNSGGV